MTNRHGTPLAALVLALVFSCAAARAETELTFDPRVRQLPSDHQGPFVKLPGGDILAIDSSQSLLSRDGGKTWRTRPLFSRQQIERYNIKVSRERALLRTREGTVIAAFMNLNEQHWTWSDALHDAPGAKLPTYVMRSLDGGKTWQDIQKMHDDWTGAVRDMIQTKEGRVIFSAMKMLHDPGRHTVLTYSSTDDGKTWKASNLIDLGGMGHHGGVTEATLVELPDGRIWKLIRTNWMQFWSGYSFDGGQNWRVLRPSGIPASSAPGMLARLASGRLVLLWNRPYPAGEETYPLRGGDGLWSQVPVSNHRGELSIAFSSDEGRTWSKPAVLASKPNTSLAYPYVFEPEPGRLWITTMQGGLRMTILEQDFLSGRKP